VRDHEAADGEEVADGGQIERHAREAGAVERVRLARVRAVGGAVEPLDGRRRRRGRGRVLRPRRRGERAQAEEEQQQQQRAQPQRWRRRPPPHRGFSLWIGAARDARVGGGGGGLVAKASCKSMWVDICAGMPR